MADGDRERDRLAALLEDIEAEFSGFCVIPKPDSRMQRAIHRALSLFTFGRMRDYLDGYHTTIGRRVYVTADWSRLSPDRQYLILRHERVHLRQFRRYSLPGMALLYLLVPLPLGLAYFRARFERAAYAETIRAAAEIHGLAHVCDPDFKNHIVEQFCGPSYGWMWPFRRSVERWYARVLADLGPGL